jgi:DNA-binding MarR family transcriptional regulator
MGFGDLFAPGARVFESVVANGRDAGLIVHGERPVLEVHDLELPRNGCAANLSHPFRDLQTKAPRPRAADNDQNFVIVYHTRNMGLPRGDVKVQNTRNLAKLGAALIDLIGFLNSPQRDEALLREAGVSLDRALFPLLVALGARGALGVAELAEQVGRDHTTVSRQLAKLESLELVARTGGESDRRRRATQLTDDGRKVVRAITLARRRLLSRVLAGWSELDRAALADLNRRFADALTEFARDRG